MSSITPIPVPCWMLPPLIPVKAIETKPSQASSHSDRSFFRIAKIAALAAVLFIPIVLAAVWARKGAFNPPQSTALALINREEKENGFLESAALAEKQKFIQHLLNLGMKKINPPQSTALAEKQKLIQHLLHLGMKTI